MSKKQITSHASVRNLEIDNAMRTAERFAKLGNVAKAAPIYQRILDGDPHHAGAQAKLAELAFTTSAFDIAIGLAQRSLARDPTGPYALSTLCLLGRSLQVSRQPREAAAAFRRAIALAPGHVEAHVGLGTALIDTGERDGAVRSFRMALQLDPRNTLAAHMLGSLGDKPGAGDPDFIRDLFDDYAGYFDQHLTQTLGYRVPQDMRAALTAALPDRRFPSALDLGCGTGLVAQHFAGLFDVIDGVDLSSRMVATAREKQLYRALYEADIAGFLGGQSGPWDLVTAADTFIYVGDLAPVFAGLKPVLSADGVIVFSIELKDSAGYAVQATARYAHSKAYVSQLAADNGYDVLAFTDVPIRTENAKPIPGSIAILRNAG